MGDASGRRLWLERFCFVLRAERVASEQTGERLQAIPRVVFKPEESGVIGDARVRASECRSGRKFASIYRAIRRRAVAFSFSSLVTQTAFRTDRF